MIPPNYVDQPCLCRGMGGLVGGERGLHLVTLVTSGRATRSCALPTLTHFGPDLPLLSPDVKLPHNKMSNHKAGRCKFDRQTEIMAKPHLELLRAASKMSYLPTQNRGLSFFVSEHRHPPEIEDYSHMT